MIYAFTNNTKTIKTIKETGLNVLFANPRWVTVDDFKAIAKGDRIMVDETSKEVELIVDCGKKLGIKLEDFSAKEEAKEEAKKPGRPPKADK